MMRFLHLALCGFKTAQGISKKFRRVLARTSLVILPACFAWLGGLCGSAAVLPVFAEESDVSVSDGDTTVSDNGNSSGDSSTADYVTKEELDSAIASLNERISTLSNNLDTVNSQIEDLQNTDTTIGNSLTAIDTRLDNYIQYVSNRDKTISENNTTIQNGYSEELKEIKDEVNQISVLFSGYSDQIKVLNSDNIKNDDANIQLIRDDLSARWAAEDGYTSESNESNINFASVFVVGIGMVVGSIMGLIFTRWYQNVAR